MMKQPERINYVQFTRELDQLRVRKPGSTLSRENWLAALRDWAEQADSEARDGLPVVGAMSGRKHPGNPAKMPEPTQAAIRAWERKAQAGLVCWFCTDDAVATLVVPSLQPVYRDGHWSQQLVHTPVCDPDGCTYQR